MRVLHVLCDLSGGGAERLVLGLCGAGLVAQEVATVQPGGTLRGAFEAAGVRVHEGTRRPHQFGSMGSLGLGSLRGLARLARSFDLVHTHLFAGDTWGRVAARMAGRPSVSTEHNVNRDEGAPHRAVKRVLAPLSGRIAYVSEACRRYAVDVEGIVHPGAVVIPNGVDLRRYSGAAIAGGPGTRLLAIGRDVPQKGFDVLLRSLPDGVSLRIAGRSAQRGIQHIGGATVEWLGEREDVAALLAEADILVVPSRWEGFGLVAVEGMAAGVPVVASDVDGLPDVLGDVGVLVPPEDADALRAVLLRLRGDPEERAQRGARGRDRAALFSLDTCARRYRSLYVDVLAGLPPNEAGRAR